MADPNFKAPVVPLTPEQTKAEEASAAKEGYVHRDLVAVDEAANVIVFKGQPDETISSHAARAAEQGKTWGKILSGLLNLFQSDHGAKAQAGDVERAENVQKLEEKSGGIS